MQAGPSKMSKGDGPRVLQSVDRAARILELLASEPEGLALGEMAERLDLKPQTLQGLVRSLQAHDMVLQSQKGGAYVLGSRIHELSRTWLGRCDRALLARDVARELARRIGEPVMLSQLRGGRLFALVDVHADQPLSVSHNQLREAPLHTMATGKLLLAHVPEGERERIVQAQDYRPLGPQTVSTPSELLAQLEQTRRQGYALTQEEASAGVAAVAVPVLGPDDHVEAALGAAMPICRYTPEHVAEVLAQLRVAAGEIAVRWGTRLAPDLP